MGFTVGSRLDPGDSTMLDPTHWCISACHSQANGSATANTDALAKYGQSYYGGATDSYLHCSTATGKGVWMSGINMPTGGKWIAEFSLKLNGPDSTHAWGWPSPWVLAASGTGGAQELDIIEAVGWSASNAGYASSTLRNNSGTVVSDATVPYYNSAFTLADGNFHTYTLGWDHVNGNFYVIWDRVMQYSHSIPSPSVQMALQIITGYTTGDSNVPGTWSAAQDSVYSYVRYWSAT